MTTQDFEKELRALHADFAVLPSKFENLMGVYLRGTYLFGIPAHNIYDTENPSYGIDGLDGRFMRHRTRPEALAMAKQMLHDFRNDQDYHDALTGEGKYSDQELQIGKFASEPTSDPAHLILPS
jgi:hypothetical protein